MRARELNVLQTRRALRAQNRSNPPLAVRNRYSSCFHCTLDTEHIPPTSKHTKLSVLTNHNAPVRFRRIWCGIPVLNISTRLSRFLRLFLSLLLSPEHRHYIMRDTMTSKKFRHRSPQQQPSSKGMQKRPKVARSHEMRKKGER